MLTTSGMKRLVRYLASTELAVALFLGISLVAIPGTFLEKRTLYSSPFFLSLLGLFGLNLILCTLRRYKTLAKPVFLFHGGVLLTLFGCVLTSFGYVATVNIYEGTVANHAYRWDLEKDMPLGIGLKVKKINWDFYQMPIKVGVLKGEKKERLYTLKTGESFEIGNYQVRVGSPEYPSENLKLSVSEKGRLLGVYNTSGLTDLPADFPYSFKLVAYRTPNLKRMWVDLELRNGSEKVAEGTSEVNKPFQWNDLSFYHIQVERDNAGVPYAGIQIVKDPGRPFVFAGFSVLALGAVLASKRRFF